MHTRAPLLGEPLPVELMNTVWADRDGVHDALGSIDDAAGWLVAVAGRTSVSACDVTTMDARDMEELVSRLRRLRNALRRLAAEATGDPRPAEPSRVTDLRVAVREVNKAAASAPSWPALSWPAGAAPTRTVQAARPAEYALVSTIAEQAIAFFSGEQRTRLRACLAPGCVLFFTKDHPRREWCGPACGNRARVARHYQRHRVSRGAAGTSSDRPES
jgi:predicted RNA-binding Zn ribbon-like protein